MVGVTNHAALDPNGLLVALNGQPVSGEMVTIASGANLVAGDALGQITASGKYIKSLSAAVDGSQAIVAVLAEDCDASGGDKSAFVYYTGEFNENKIGFGTGHTAAANRRALAQKGIHIHKPLAD
ncbi:MAG TPA: head decoration protein [Vitreimonas sp.]|uniref:head decoration protein n=1 Tax=Vitreimonas sp. TaxID=3069702 RepID=UPI002D68A407|nr:head decoration protein [Vitreimonas sp.]HYD87119.1 head decoration protein [Vitreimonas sp.]